MNDDAHKHLALEDTLAELGELEHLRYHALRSAFSTEAEEDRFFYLVTASRAQRLRRQVQSKLGDISETDWCLLKSAQRVRQLNYELMEGDIDMFRELEELVDSINTHALKRDMSGCQACRSDKETMLASDE